MPDTSDHRPLHYVIGSGPGGVACAHALLERGARVILLDAGIKLEEPRRIEVARMAALAPQRWSPEQIKWLKTGMKGGLKGIPLKLAYGSDYPYRDTDIHLPADYQGVALQPSLGQGGFSAVWGAAMMPYSEKDMMGWPISPGDLATHYAAVAKFTGLTGVHDGLEKLFPLYSSPLAALKMSRQAQNLYSRLDKNREPLEAAGVYFGRSRVAAKAGPNGCVYCGLCMYGCPYGFIYNSEQTLGELAQNPDFTLKSDVVVTRLQEAVDGVRIIGHNRLTRENFEISAPRVYLAAGVVSTAGIVMRSLGLYDETIRLKDSQYFLFPLITRGGGDVQKEALHTLGQLFIEILDPEVTPRSVHLQVYSYNDLIGQAVRQPFGPMAGMLDWFARALERRLLIVQGYLHSDQSSKIAVRLRRGTPDRLQLQAEISPEVRPAIRRVFRKLQRHARQMGAWPLSPLMQIAEPGRGFHSGGSFPMRLNPGKLETDVLGRLPGWQRIHIVDASVLPDVPATQITFSVMANAHRIASATAGEG